MTLRKYAVAACVIAAMLSFTACGQNSGDSSQTSSQVTASAQALSEESFSAENIVKTALDRNLAQKSSTAKMTTEFKFEGDDGEATAVVATDIKAITDPVFKHILMDVSQNGEHFSTSEFYVDEAENGDMTLYISYGEEWYKMPVTDGELFAVLGQYDVREVTNIVLNSLSNVTVGDKEDVNGVEAYKVDAVIPAADVPDVIINAGVFVANGLTNLYEEYFDGVTDMPVTFYVDASTGDIVKLSFDAGQAFQIVSDYAYNLAQEIDEYKDSQRLVVNNYTVVMDISNIDSTEKEEIPTDVTEGQELPSLSESIDEANGVGASSSATSSQETAE